MTDSFSILFLISLFLWITVLILLIIILSSIRRKAKKQKHKCKKAALFIDADNTNYSFMEKILEYLEQVFDGEIVYSCLYGLPSSQKSWEKTAKEHSIQQKTLNNYLEGKNSTDFSIVIDCMDLLLNDDIDAFVIVSSDSDFSGIAYRIQKEGKTVIGMGKDQTPVVFRAACSQFFYLDNKNTSPADLERVLGELVIHYNGRVSYGQIKHLITNRFGLNMMGFDSFDQVLEKYGYTATRTGVIVKNYNRTARKK